MHDKPDASLSAELLLEARRRLGERLRKLREQRRLTQGQVGAYAGVDQSVWSRVEAGHIDPRLSWLLSTQHLLGIESLETLFGPAPSHRLLVPEEPRGEGGEI